MNSRLRFVAVGTTLGSYMISEITSPVRRLEGPIGSCSNWTCASAQLEISERTKRKADPNWDANVPAVIIFIQMRSELRPNSECDPNWQRALWHHQCELASRHCGTPRT